MTKSKIPTAKRSTINMFLLRRFISMRRITSRSINLRNGDLIPFMKKLKKLYDWVLHWAHTPYGVPALFGISFAESSFFPVPPDVLQIALSISRPAKSFYYAAVSSVASVLGGIFGYGIGLFLMDIIGWPILRMYGLQTQYEIVQA